MSVTTENRTGEMGWITRSLAYKLNFPPPFPFSLKRKTQPKIFNEPETFEIKISNYSQESGGTELAEAGLEEGVTLISGRMIMCCSYTHHQQHK